jgi:hypothetical protein
LDLCDIWYTCTIVLLILKCINFCGFIHIHGFKGSNNWIWFFGIHYNEVNMLWCRNVFFMDQFMKIGIQWIFYMKPQYIGKWHYCHV